jgi:hypothetical protein
LNISKITSSKISILGIQKIMKVYCRATLLVLAAFKDGKLKSLCDKYAGMDLSLYN